MGPPPKPVNKARQNSNVEQNKIPRGARPIKPQPSKKSNDEETVRSKQDLLVQLNKQAEENATILERERAALLALEIQNVESQRLQQGGRGGSGDLLQARPPVQYNAPPDHGRRNVRQHDFRQDPSRKDFDPSMVPGLGGGAEPSTPFAVPDGFRRLHRHNSNPMESTFPDTPSFMPGMVFSIPSFGGAPSDSRNGRAESTSQLPPPGPRGQGPPQGMPQSPGGWGPGGPQMGALSGPPPTGPWPMQGGRMSPAPSGGDLLNPKEAYRLELDAQIRLKENARQREKAAAAPGYPFNPPSQAHHSPHGPGPPQLWEGPSRADMGPPPGPMYPNNGMPPPGGPPHPHYNGPPHGMGPGGPEGEMGEERGRRGSGLSVQVGHGPPPVGAGSPPGGPGPQSPGSGPNARPFMSGLQALRPGPSDEQRREQENSRQQWQRDLEEQIRQKKMQKEAAKAAEAAARRKEEAELMAYNERLRAQQEAERAAMRKGAEDENQAAAKPSAPPARVAHVSDSGRPPSDDGGGGGRVARGRRAKHVVDASWLDNIPAPRNDHERARSPPPMDRLTADPPKLPAKYGRRAMSAEGGETGNFNHMNQLLQSKIPAPPVEPSGQKSPGPHNHWVGPAYSPRQGPISGNTEAVGMLLAAVHEEQSRLREEMQRQAAAMEKLATEASSAAHERDSAWQALGRVKAMLGDGGEGGELFVVTTHLLPKRTNMIPEVLPPPQAEDGPRSSSDKNGTRFARVPPPVYVTRMSALKVGEMSGDIPEMGSHYEDDSRHAPDSRINSFFNLDGEPGPSDGHDPTGPGAKRRGAPVHGLPNSPAILRGDHLPSPKGHKGKAPKAARAEPGGFGRGPPPAKPPKSRLNK